MKELIQNCLLCRKMFTNLRCHLSEFHAVDTMELSSQKRNEHCPNEKCSSRCMCANAISTEQIYQQSCGDSLVIVESQSTDIVTTPNPLSGQIVTTPHTNHVSVPSVTSNDNVVGRTFTKDISIRNLDSKVYKNEENIGKDLDIKSEVLDCQVDTIVAFADDKLPSKACTDMGDDHPYTNLDPSHSIEKSKTNLTPEIMESVCAGNKEDRVERCNRGIKVRNDNHAQSHFHGTLFKLSTPTIVKAVQAKDKKKTLDSMSLKASLDLSFSENISMENDSENWPIDFHFMLGTTKIKGNSMSYERIEFRCLHCSFCTAWRPSLMKHMKSAHRDTLAIHEIVDIRNNRFSRSSNKLGQNFQVVRMSDYLAKHLKAKMSMRRTRRVERQDIPGKYHCQICHKVFSRIRYIRRHQAAHYTERPHLCDTCGISFKTKATLSAHKRTHRLKIYNCPQCSFVSSNSAAIHHHRQIHPNGSVVCDICGAAYNDKSTLKKHRLVHDSDIRPFPCTHPGCTWRFKTDASRVAHVRAHTTEGKFRCPHCGYNFRQKHHLQRHVAKLHPNMSTGLPESRVKSAQSAKSNRVKEVTSNSKAKSKSSISETQAPSVTVSPFSVKQENQTFDGSNTKISISETALENGAASPLTVSSTSRCITVAEPSFTSVLMDSDHQTMIEVLVDDKQEHVQLLVGDKPDHVVVPPPLGSEDGNPDNPIDIPASNANNLEYITESGDVVQLLRPGQTYMGRDEQGNLVEYKIADMQDTSGEGSSHPIYFIGVDGTVVGTVQSQDQALLVSSK